MFVVRDAVTIARSARMRVRASMPACALVQRRGYASASMVYGGSDTHVGIDRLASLWRKAEEHVVVLSGAGLSTASGIPDYRSPGRPPHNPITLQQFMSAHSFRQRYWARSMLGYRTMSEAAPNQGHRALALLESHNAVSLNVTQNVDGLLQRAGVQRVLELHGSIHSVVCTGCGACTPRREHQVALEERNPEWAARYRVLLTHRGVGLDATPSPMARPDGDRDLGAGTDYSSFRVLDCTRCGALLRPNVVLFGGAVPREVNAAARDAVARARLLVAVGTSLAVYSSFRYVRQAAASGVPVVVVNRQATRGDTLAALRIDDDCTHVLDAVAVGLS